MNNIRYIHMLGINGISMSGLAEILISRGIRVTGSDLTSSGRTERLKELGAKVYMGNSRANLCEADPPELLVYTAAAGPDNPERVQADALGIKSIDRAELLGRIMAEYGTSIGVSGTHGKTTTTAMIASILLAGGLDPTINIGGEYELIGGTSRVGGSDFFLAEACEYTDSFLKLHPSISVITNIEYDHVDYFKDINQLRASFEQFARQAGDAVAVNADDENVGIVIDQIWNGDGAVKPRLVTFGINAMDADFRASDICRDEEGGISFTLTMSGRETIPLPKAYNVASCCAVSDSARIPNGLNDRASQVCFSVGLDSSARVRLRVPGYHNVYNALAAAAAAVTAGCAFETAARELETFEGAKKRFEYKGQTREVHIVDDYAHHPTEVRTALATAREFARGGRVFCVFHPHTYTRTKAFLYDFANAFTAADLVLLADIFAAREDDPGDISSAILADEINKAGGSATYFPGGFPAIANWLRETTKPGDLVLTMGAGLSSAVADILLGNKA